MKRKSILGELDAVFYPAGRPVAPHRLEHHRDDNTVGKIAADLVKAVMPQIKSVLSVRNELNAELKATQNRIAAYLDKIRILDGQAAIMRSEVTDSLVAGDKPDKKQQRCRLAESEADDIRLWIKELERREQDLIGECDLAENKLYTAIAGALSNGERLRYAVEVNRLLQEATKLEACWRQAVQKTIADIRGTDSRPTNAANAPVDWRLPILNNAWHFQHRS
jgi:hypothetical protein